MKIFDAHCDVLYKLWLNPTIDVNHDPCLQVSFDQLKKTGSKIQCFAIYVPESVRYEQRFDVALEMIEIFYHRILSKSYIKLIRKKQDVDCLKKDEIGAILSLEGCDAIHNSITRLQTLIRLGVSSVGLTWNYANAVADGAAEQRGAGLTLFGEKVVKENNHNKIWTDVSHLSERGFWDVMDIAEFPIASHSNAYSICPHERNLRDDQIKSLIKKNGMIGIAFVPAFLSKLKTANISDVLKHIEHICSLGGENNLGFGSDFDGSDQVVQGIESYQNYSMLINELEKIYSSEQVKKFLFDNFENHLPK